MARPTASATLRRWRPAWELLLAAALSTGCASPDPIAPPRVSDVSLDGDCIVWTTSVPTRGWVRFGRAPGQYAAVAYPAAAGRGDRRYATQHRIPLLGIGAGETVHLQVLDEAAGGSALPSGEYTFRFTNATNQRPLLRWTMIDVGFGDSHLLTMPGTGRRILVDAGERRDWVNVNRFLADAAITRLDAVIATHIHADHVGGMVGDAAVANDGVLGAYDVGTFLEGPDPSASRTAYDEILALLASRGIARLRLQRGDTDASNTALAWDPGVRVRTLNAGDGQALGGSEDDWLNNDSVVLRIGFGDVDLVLGGDAEAPAENAIVQRGGGLESEVLKIHHHGVNDASTSLFLAAVNPHVGMIPIATYESFDGTLPSTAVVGRLRERRIHIYASDRAEPLGIALIGDHGLNVTVVTDGVSYQVEVAASASVHVPGSARPAGTGSGKGDAP